MTCKVKLFTVPGQVMHNTTRKVVLQGCDGVAFIADSQIAETKNNNESFANLKANMKENRLDPDDDPDRHPVQQARPAQGAHRRRSRSASPRAARSRCSRRSPIQGKGVVETFLGLAAATWETLEKKMGLGSKHGIPKAELLAALAQAARRRGAQARELLGIGKGG